MTTTKELRKWYDLGVAKNAAYMAIWTDTFDYTDFPVYYKTKEEAQAEINKDGENMQKVMEVYDLHGDKEKQLEGGTRTWDLVPAYDDDGADQ
jgi:hypothetical protein